VRASPNAPFSQPLFSRRRDSEINYVQEIYKKRKPLGYKIANKSAFFAKNIQSQQNSPSSIKIIEQTLQFFSTF